MPNQVTNWGDALMASLSSAFSLFFLAVPRILGFVVILVIGWILASLTEKALAAVLRKVHFDGFAARAGLAGFIEKTGMRTDASGTIALIAKWFVRLLTLMIAFDALGLPAVSDVLRQLLLWLPNLIVALVVLVIGGIAANALSTVVRGAAAKGELGNPELLARVAKSAVWVFAVVVAINQIGIAASLVNIFFMGFVGAIAIALGLSFGLGGRETAGEIVRGWHLRQQGGRLARNMRTAANENAGGNFDGNVRRSLIGGYRRDPYGRGEG
ncbi:mechanosensitive ion channel family protein [Massilia glaciei]|uniref:Small-conductance mechanosensitive ion channel n=1 Tax=Massilia glaciei TaxID=1524097 RepID=A0A2U2HNU1_9BURK|nr:small-conductance mechanosensitive ion channel [Massilia glaciei]PWF49096.1 small-conductance mechanosensitive ion channel [Massilia glaciei]